ncbi:hypothetical protein H2199_002908 [Coniosporium tulheliwenetii]|uniref:Uncharacterized protein n=1 Tax=Coniosporium tulheliwenetii TaxID=3383036 RepID=A0ACC2ZDT7_9PEZI|nr:hypothetical protein H2199_002908 [Cladosporium sp. JES 115]
MVKTINKRRGRKPAEQALKEKDLQESLQHGHRAVQERYLADYQRFGQPFRTGDEPTFEEMVAQLESTQIGNEAQGETGSVRNSSTISAGSANSVHSGRVPSVASVSETTNSASPPSTSTPSTPGVSSPVSPPGPSPSSSTGCVQYQRPPHMRPTIDTRHTIEMPPTGGQLLGRANQKNNYWGFCKGAWSTRESLDEGLRVRTQPEGFFSTVSFWECRHCHFRGERYRTKPEMVDQTIYKTACGIRYRWLFLAKSHTRANSLAQAGQRRGGPNYGCVFCCAEGRPTGVYGDVETLMNHIYPTHGRQMSADIQRRMKCVVGCVADSAGDWDLNIPLAPESEEPRVSEMPADDNNIPVPVPVSRVEPGGTAARRAAGFGPVWCAGSGPLNAPVGGIMFRC